MRIYVLGSNAFMKKMVEVTDKLIEMGFDGYIAPHYRELVAGTRLDMQGMLDAGERAKVKQQFNTFKYHFGEIQKADALLFVNEEKRGIKNYIGGNVLIEMGQGFVLDKKIFFLNGMPEGLSYMDEIVAMDPVLLNGDLENIRKNI